MSDSTFVFSRNKVVGAHLYEALCRYWSIVNLVLMNSGDSVLSEPQNIEPE